MASTIPQDKQRAPLTSPHMPSTSIYPYASSAGNSLSMSSGFGMGPAQTLNDSLGQSRPQYQPGYLLSLAQSQVSPVPGQRFEEPLLIPTRAKMSSTYARNTPSDFGSDSIFESTSSKHRRRETVSDEDGPPTSSVVDLVTEINVDHNRQVWTPAPALLNTLYGNKANSPPNTPYQILYVIVFGYPLTRYTSTLAHFQSIAEGGTTEPETSADVENAFRIGYKQPWEAARAWKWNGEIISGEGGRWMIGVKWADPVAAEQILGSGARIPTLISSTAGAETPLSLAQERSDVVSDQSHSQFERTDLPQQGSTPTVGTPIKLVPSSSAFRKGQSELSRKQSALHRPAGTDGSPAKGKGMFGQVSDLIFGW